MCVCALQHLVSGGVINTKDVFIFKIFHGETFLREVFNLG
jgi:hypothetical protein